MTTLVKNSKFELSKWHSLVMTKIVDKSMNKKFYSICVNERSIVALVAEFTV